jgi:NAD(P)-dependent dehydrogenase (short-subunit alcohol dehydrogenase family)
MTSKTVFITGANRGIGLQFAKVYSAKGWNVIGTARDVAAATEVTNRLLLLLVRVNLKMSVERPSSSSGAVRLYRRT